MTFIDIILFIVAIILTIIFFITLTKNYLKNRKTISFFKSNLFKYSISIFGVIFLGLMIVKFIHPKSKLLSPTEQIEYGKKYKAYLFAANGYNQVLKDSPDDFQLNYNYTNCFYEQINVFYSEREMSYKECIDKVKESDKFYDLINYYHHIIDKETNIKRLDIAHLFLTYNFLNTEDFDLAEFHFNNIYNKNRPYYNFIEGYYYYKTSTNIELDTITSLLNKSINEKLAIKHSVEILTKIYFNNGNNSKLSSLIENKNTQAYVPFYFKRIHYLTNHQYLNYFVLLVNHDFSNAYWLGAIFAFIISLIWVIYLRSIDVFERDKWYQLTIVFILSCFSIYLIYPYHDYFLSWLNFQPSNTWFSKFIFDFISIGIIEEIVKIIPVLIILKFTKFINEPYDYILYASVSALGFAFIENLQYLSETSLYNINARLLYAAVGHMFFTSIWAYCMLLGKYYYKFKYKMIIMFVSGWILAALSHAFYDFWILHFDRNFHQFTTIFLIISIHIWAIMKNNALNLSNFHKNYIHVNNEKINLFLITSLLIVFMGSYITISVLYNKQSGYNFLISNLFSYFFFIIYLSFSFSNYEIIRGHLSKLSLPDNILTNRLTIKKDNLVNQSSITLFKTKVNHIDFIDDGNYKYDIFPLKGTIVEKIMINKNPSYYLIKTNTPINIHKYENNFVVVYKQKAKSNSKNKVLVKVLLVNSNVNLKSTTLKKRDFKLLGYSVLKID